MLVFYLKPSIFRKVMSDTDTQIQIDATRIKNHLLALKSDRDQAIKRGIDEAEKKPTSISLAKAFLTCTPNGRSSFVFTQALEASFNDKSLIAVGNEDAVENLVHDLQGDLRSEDMAFIERLVKNPRYATIRIALPHSAP